MNKEIKDQIIDMRKVFNRMVDLVGIVLMIVAFQSFLEGYFESSILYILLSFVLIFMSLIIYTVVPSINFGKEKEVKKQ